MYLIIYNKGYELHFFIGTVGTNGRSIDITVKGPVHGTTSDSQL